MKPPKRTTKLACILFADVKGFSELDTSQLQAYAEKLVPDLAALIDPHRSHLLEVNTWGDGFFILSRKAQGLAELALDMRDFFRKCRWGDYGLPELKIRIALHSAEVFLYPNRIKGKLAKDAVIKGCIGTEVNIASRIEPITPPNHIWTTAVFKEMVTGTGPHGPQNMSFDRIGPYPLAKSAGEIEIWHLRRQAFDTASPIPPQPITVDPLPESRDVGRVLRYTNRIQRLAKCANGEEVKMIAITAKAALLPNARPDEVFYRFPIPAAIKRGVTLKLIVLDPDSAEATFRSAVESGVEVPLAKRFLQRDAREVADTLMDVYRKQARVSTTWIRQHLQIRRTTIGVGFSLWLFNDIAFTEPHHFGKEEANRNLCHFATMVIPNGTREYSLLNKHFSVMWDAGACRKLVL